jgi:uncharacterized protein YhaN
MLGVRSINLTLLMVASMDKNIICMSDDEFYAWVANNPQYSHLEEEVKAIIAQLEQKQREEEELKLSRNPIDGGCY